MIIKRFLLFTFLSICCLCSAYAQVVSISGQVLRHNGDPLANVMVTCTNGDLSLTDDNGNFLFSDLPSGQDYQIDGIFEASIFEGVSVLDVCSNRFFINQIYTPLNSQLIANDFNQDGLYQGLDLIRLANAGIKIENTQNQLDNSWRFFDGNIDNISINTLDIESGIQLANLTSDVSDLVLIAVKSGDMAIDADHQPAPEYASKPSFYITDMPIEQNEEIILQVKTRDLERIMGFQHALAWDTNFLEFISFENKTNIFTLLPNEEYAAEGTFAMMEINLNFFGDQMDDTAIYEIRFQALQNAISLEGIIEFDTVFMQEQVVYLDSSSLLYITDAEYGIEENIPSSITESKEQLISFDISPNPVQNEISFSIQLLNDEPSTLSLIDINGRVLENQTFYSNTVTGKIPINNLPNGVYYLQFQTKKGISTKSFVKL